MTKRIVAATSVAALCLLVFAGPARAQINYTFNGLTGTDAYPFTNLNGQDGWTSQGYPANLIMGVTATAGFDVTQCLRFVDVGSGYGADASHKRTASFLIPAPIGQEPRIVLQGDFMVGAWGNQLNYAYDANSDGLIRQTVATEIGPGVDIGAVPGLCGISAAGTRTCVTLPTLGINAMDWVRIRLELDPMNRGTGVGRVSYQDLTRGDTGLQPVAALQAVDMQFNWSAAGVVNPALWDAIFIHLEGSDNRFDNLVASADAATLIPAAGPFGLAVLGMILVAAGLIALRLRR